jgi:hypothetical protein
MSRSFVLGALAWLTACASLVSAQNASPILDDPSKLKFAVPCDSNVMNVVGILAPEIDLSQDDATAMQIFDRAERFAREKCSSTFQQRSLLPGLGYVLEIKVTVRHGDPAKFTDEFRPPESRRVFDAITKSYPDVVVEAVKSLAQKGGWSGYRNLGKERLEQIEKTRRADALRAQQQAEAERQAKARSAQQAEAERQQREQQAQRDAQLLRQREAERVAMEKERQDIRARSAAFVSANSVKRFVTAQELAVNPFAYQGQTVAVQVLFEGMDSPTEGFFSADRDSVLIFVSATPSARFTKPKSPLILAARVLGKREVKLPLLGATSVPHLSFVGSAFCQKPDCSDYSISVK